MTHTIHTQMTTKEWLMISLLSLLWGGSFFFIEIALTELPTLTLVFLRVFLAAVALWLFVFFKGITVPKSMSIWFSFFCMGLLNNVIPFSLIVWGQTHITSGLASIFNATTPLFTVMVAALLLSDETLKKNKVIGIIFGFIGILIMIGHSALEGVSVNIFAKLAVLGAALSYACAGVYGRRFKDKGIHPIVAAAGQISASALFLCPFVCILNGVPHALPSIKVVCAISALAIVSTAIAYVLYFKLLASAGATNVSLVTFLVPVSAIILGIVVLNETLLLPQIIGMAVIALGLITLDGRLWSNIKIQSTNSS